MKRRSFIGSLASLLFGKKSSKPVIKKSSKPFYNSTKLEKKYWVGKYPLKKN